MSCITENDSHPTIVKDHNFCSVFYFFWIYASALFNLLLFFFFSSLSTGLSLVVCSSRRFFTYITFYYECFHEEGVCLELCEVVFQVCSGDGHIAPCGLLYVCGEFLSFSMAFWLIVIVAWKLYFNNYMNLWGFGMGLFGLVSFSLDVLRSLALSLFLSVSIVIIVQDKVTLFWIFLYRLWHQDRTTSLMAHSNTRWRLANDFLVIKLSFSRTTVALTILSLLEVCTCLPSSLFLFPFQSRYTVTWNMNTTRRDHNTIQKSFGKRR